MLKGKNYIIYEKQLGDLRNEKEFEFLGIKRFHNAGYLGQGITICSKENVLENVYNDVFGLEYEKDRSNKYSIHGTTVMDYIRQVVPKATKWAIETKGRIDSKNILHSEGMEFLQENVPDVLTTSFFKMTDTEEPKKSLYKQLYNKGCFMCLSAGNKNEEIEKLAEGDIWKAIGACRYNNGNPKVEKDYAQGKEMDFVSFHRLIAMWDNSKNKDVGTSFSAPIFAGMVALVQCFFKENIGRKLNHEELIEFIKENCIDLETEGRDNKTGYGLFILPDPKTIKIEKYLGDTRKIILKINNNKGFVDGKEITLDTEPIIYKDRTLVPIRFIAETFGCKVNWIEDTQEVIIEKGN